MYGRVAQAGAAVMLVAGIGVAAVGIPLLAKTPEPDVLVLPVVELPQPPSRADDPSRSRVDAGGLAARMGMVSNSPKAPDVPVTQGTDTTDTTTAPPAPVETRFLGTAKIGGVVLALVHDGAKQRFVKIGDTVGEDEIVEITAEFIRVRRGEVERTIDMATRGGEIYSRASGAFGPRGTSTAAANAAKAQAGAKLPTPSVPRPITPPSRQGNVVARSVAAPTNFRPMESNPGRLDEILVELKQTGNYKTEDDMRAVAKEQYEKEMNEAEENRRNQQAAPPAPRVPTPANPVKGGK